QPGVPESRIVPYHAAQESGQVDRDVIALDAAIVYHPGQTIAFKQYVVMPDVAQAGLKRQGAVRPGNETTRNLVAPAEKQFPGAPGPGHHRVVDVRVQDGSPTRLACPHPILVASGTTGYRRTRL